MSRSRARRQGWGDIGKGLAFLSPWIVGFSVFTAAPIVMALYFSFCDYGITDEPLWIGLDNYRDLWHDTIWWDSVVVTVKFTAITVSIELVLGLIIALVVNSGFKGRGVMRAVMLVPWAIPTVVAAQMWKWMYDDVFGVVNDGLVRLHVIDRPVAWISEEPLAAVAAVDIWKTTPFVALLLLAGLQVIPHELYEAADVDGASKWNQFWKITLPLLVPAILVTLIFRTLDALRVFDVFYVFFGSRADTQTMAIYNQNTIVAFGDTLCQPGVDWQVLREYQKHRVCTLLDPTQDPLGKGFHIIQSTIAIGSGGVFGKGWQSGTQTHLAFLPERHTDFIFAVLAEEFGLAGALVLLGLYVLLLARGLQIALHAPTLATRLLAGAMTMIFFTYAFVNMGMVSGILPVVGVPLPFISYGGTALVTLCLGIGILMSIQRSRLAGSA